MTDALKDCGAFSRSGYCVRGFVQGNSVCECRIVSQSISLAALGKCYAGSGTIWQCKILNHIFTIGNRLYTCSGRVCALDMTLCTSSNSTLGEKLLKKFKTCLSSPLSESRRASNIYPNQRASVIATPMSSMLSR